MDTVRQSDFTNAVEQLAYEIWNKYGPGAYASNEAYNELKEKVRFSSWIVSPAHRKDVVEFTKQLHSDSQQSLYEQAIAGMVEFVWRQIKRIVSENSAQYFCVEFPDQNRWLTFEDIYSEERPPKVPMSKVQSDGTVTAHQRSNAVHFRDSTEAEEHAEEFCKAYIISGMTSPTIKIVAFNKNDEPIPAAKMFIPSVLMKIGGFPYPQDKIPVWCRMEKEAHDVAGGCWGISFGDVERQGRDFCLECELNDRTESVK